MKFFVNRILTLPWHLKDGTVQVPPSLETILLFQMCKMCKFFKRSNHITSSKMTLSHLVSGKSYQEIGQSHLAHEFSQNTPMQFVEQHFLPPRTCQSHCHHHGARHVGEIVAIFIVITVI